MLRFHVNGKPSVATFDGYASQVQPGKPIDLGIFTPENGHFILRAEVTGASPLSRGARFYFGLDCVGLAPVP